MISAILTTKSPGPRRQTSPTQPTLQSPFWSFGDEPKGPYSIFYAAKNGTLKNPFQSNLAQINIADKDGITALHIACENGEDEGVDALLECGANMNLQNKKGMTPLHLACENGFTTIVAKMLQCESIQLEIENKEGKTPLALAMSNNHGKIASLLKRRINVDTITHLSCVVEASKEDDNQKLNLKCLDDYTYLYKQIAEFLIIKA